TGAIGPASLLAGAETSRRHLMRTRTLLIGLLLLTAPRIASAQSTLANIVGVVRDQSALALPGASVTLQDLDQNTKQDTVSDGDGAFQFLNLKPGRYTITVREQGFADLKVNEVQLAARQTFRVSATLSLAGLQEAVKVVGEAPAINTETGTIADSKSAEQVTELPVNYRGATTSPLAAIATVPGVQQDNSGNVSIGGGTPAMVQYSVDGVSSVNVRANGALANLNPSSELISEFKVTSFNNNAEF